MNTEERAKGKWCPHRAQVVGSLTGGAYATRDEEAISAHFEGLQAQPIKGMGCVASNCMLWRWEASDLTPIKGYCGLAGKPHG